MQRQEDTSKTGALMIPTVAKNICSTFTRPYLSLRLLNPFWSKNIPVCCPWLEQLPPILAEAKTAWSADVITKKGHTLRPVRGVGTKSSRHGK